MLALRLAVAAALALEEEPIHQQHHVCQSAAASALLAVVLLAQAPVHQSVESLWTWGLSGESLRLVLLDLLDPGRNRSKS